MEKNEKKPETPKKPTMQELLSKRGIPSVNTTAQYIGQSVIICMGSREAEDLKKTK